LPLTLTSNTPLIFCDSSLEIIGKPIVVITSEKVLTAGIILLLLEVLNFLIILTLSGWKNSEATIIVGLNFNLFSFTTFRTKCHNIVESLPPEKEITGNGSFLNSQYLINSLTFSFEYSSFCSNVKFGKTSVKNFFLPS
jgi:hypothetical protein